MLHRARREDRRGLNRLERRHAALDVELDLALQAEARHAFVGAGDDEQAGVDGVFERASATRADACDTPSGSPAPHDMLANMRASGGGSRLTPGRRSSSGMAAGWPLSSFHDCVGSITV